MAFRIGIDLGTTYCALAMIDAESGNPVIIKNRDGVNSIPSAVYFKNGRYKAGIEAKEIFESGDANCAVFFKRSMGEKANENDSVCFTAEKGTQYERDYTAVELSSLLLKHLKKEAELAVGDTISEAVITCPAYFYSNERDCIKRAAVAAGLKIQEILEEPAAASLSYGTRHWKAGSCILVYDLGGGTFDASLIAMDDALNIHVIGTMGRKYLGGKDFDDALLNLVLRKLSVVADIDVQLISDDERTTIRGEIEQIKKNLSDRQSIRVSGIVNGQKAAVEIKRKEFEYECQDILNETGIMINQLFEKLEESRETNEIVQRYFSNSKVSKGSITDVLLVGGSTIMPCVREYLTTMFGKPPLTHANPTTAVAEGAAIRTLKIKHEANGLTIGKNASQKNIQPQHKGKVSNDALKIMDLLKTATHTMGVIAKSVDGTEYINEHIIPSGTPIPCRFARKFKYYTSKKSINTIEIFVLQGDSLKPSECKPQDKYVVSGIRHIKESEDKGTLIRIQYSYDRHGIICVQARQEDDTIDLPINKDEIPKDMSKYSNPVESEKKSSSFLGKQTGGVNQDVVHKFKVVTFSNVEWQKYDNISVHADGSQYNEPKVHVEASEKDIKFSGYNISAMNEGVYYTINADDDFEIECEIDTSGIKPHPGGHINITLGIITAKISQHGGDILLDGKQVSNVGAKFKLKMSLTDGDKYEVHIDDKLAGSEQKTLSGNIEARFGMEHDSHHCGIISRASITNIEMRQRNSDSADGEVETWDD